MVTMDLAGKEGTQASAPTGADLLLAYGSAGLPNLSLLIGQPARDCRPSAMQFIITMLMIMMVVMLLSRGEVMGGWQNKSLAGYHLHKMASTACLTVKVRMRIRS